MSDKSDNFVTKQAVAASLFSKESLKFPESKLNDNEQKTSIEPPS